jgi:hypothetical protein
MISKSEAQPFLQRYQNEAADEARSQPKLLARLQAASTLTRSIVGFILLVAYTLLVTCATNVVVNRPALPINNGKIGQASQMVVAYHTVALQNPNISYHTNKTITAGMSPFAGGPGKKVDDAWRDLMSSISLRVSQEELNNNGNHQESVSLPENGGNLVWLNVFHQLHCLVSASILTDIRKRVLMSARK